MRGVPSPVDTEAAPPMPVADYRDRVAALLPTTPVVSLPVLDCVGLVLAEDLVAAVSLPPFDNSAMDGYAVRSVDVVEATRDGAVELPVPLDIPAGRTDVVPLRPGTAHRIMTGAPVPPGADAIVKVEDTDGGEHQVSVRAPAAPGTHIRRTGEDVREGATVLRAGTVLGSPQLGLAAAVGLAELGVHRAVRVLILSTGSELVAPGQALLHGQIYESNSVLLAAAVRETGAVATVLRFVPDDVGGVPRGDRRAHREGRPASHVRWRERGRVRGGQGRADRPGCRVRAGRRAARRTAGQWAVRRAAGGHAAGQPGERGAVVRAVPAPGAAAAMGHRTVDRARVRARAAEELRSPGREGPVPAWPPGGGHRCSGRRTRFSPARVVRRVELPHRGARGCHGGRGG